MRAFFLLFAAALSLSGNGQAIQPTFNFTIGSMTYTPNQASFQIGDSITVSWVVNTAAGYDIGYADCYVAIRPGAQVNIDDVRVIDSNNQPTIGPAKCAKGSYRFVIPPTPLTPSISYNVSDFIARINTLNQANGYNAETSSFKIYSKIPEDPSYRLARIGTITGGVGVGVAVLALLVSCFGLCCG